MLSIYKIYDWMKVFYTVGVKTIFSDNKKKLEIMRDYRCQF